MDFCIYLTSISLNLYLIISCWQWKGGSGDRSGWRVKGLSNGVKGFGGIRARSKMYLENLRLAVFLKLSS